MGAHHSEQFKRFGCFVAALRLLCSSNPPPEEPAEEHFLFRRIGSLRLMKNSAGKMNLDQLQTPNDSSLAPDGRLKLFWASSMMETPRVAPSQRV